MPGYKGHLVGGTVAFGVTYILVRSWCPSLLTAGQWLGCALAGSLFPDIDIKSKGQKYFYWVILLAVITIIMQRRFEWLAIVSVLSVVPMLVRHRGIFHRLWFVIALPMALWFGTSFYFPVVAKQLFFQTLFFIAGAISHLWLDLGFRRMVRQFF